MHQGIGSVAAEERECIPSEVSGALSPALGRNNKSVAVVDEPTPSVRRDISWMMLIVETRTTLEPDEFIE